MRAYVILLSTLFILGVIVRLWLLGDAPFSADNMDFYRLALRDQDIGEFWRNPPWLNQIPLNEVFVLLFMKTGVPASPFFVRLPFALMGILALFFMMRFTWSRLGAMGAASVLFLAALNPFHVYFARTAYHYSGAIAWAAAMFWLFWILKERIENKTPPPTGLWGAWFAVAMLACHMHMSVWVVAGLQGILLLWYAWRHMREQSSAWRRIVLTISAGGILSLLVMSRWMFRAVERLREASGGGKGLIGGEAHGEFLRLLPAFAAGESVWGLLLLASLIALTALALILSSPHRAFLRSLAIVVSIHLLVTILYIRVIGGGVAKIAYFSALWAPYMILLGGGGYLGLRHLIALNRVAAYALAVVVFGGYGALAGAGVWSVVHLEGKPTPYFEINEWVRDHLPPGTPVLVDRWYEPWNELAIHNPGDIQYTFTVPDEPLETYQQLRWRATAEQFFNEFPSAALLSVNPGKYEQEMGAWDFPERYFAQSAIITNSAAIRLSRLGFMPTRGFAPERRGRAATAIYFNETDDLIADARRHGRRVLRLYGEGWGYIKPWRPLEGWSEQLMQLTWVQAGRVMARGRGFEEMRDINQTPQAELTAYLSRGRWADYRVPSPDSSLRLFNLTDAPRRVAIRIVAMAVSGSIRARIAENSVSFPPTFMVERNVPLTLQPGEQSVTFSVRPNHFLLVLKVEVHESN